jgi:predicted TIM-barrel fold metal-dependent hydrolase
MRIDVHAHYYPKTYIDLLIALGRTDINPRSAHDADFADRIARMDEAGIDRQILSAIGLDTLLHERSAAAEAARCVNDAYAAQITRYPGRFGAFGWMPLPYVDEAIVEAARCLDDLDFDGVALACAYQGRCLDDEAFEPFWAMLNARAAVAYIHPVGRHSCGHFGMDRYTLDILIGSPSQEAVAASRLVYSQVTTRYPDIRFVLAGCGGVTPLLWEVHENLLGSRGGHRSGRSDGEVSRVLHRQRRPRQRPAAPRRHRQVRARQAASGHRLSAWIGGPRRGARGRLRRAHR